MIRGISMQQNGAKLPPLKIGRHTARKAIVQGGMGVGISMSGLAAAVAEEGGIGVISTVAIGILCGEKNFRKINRTALAKEIRKAKEKTDGVLGCNIMVAISDYDKILECAIEEGIDMLFLGAGLPLHFPKSLPPKKLREINTAFVPIVSSAKAAELIFRYWTNKFDTVPDAVVVEGPLAGGHLGFKRDQIDNPQYALEVIVPAVVSVVRTYERQAGRGIPVIAAGGVYSGGDIRKYLQLGAGGVQMGTRFVATHECDAGMAFKRSYIDAQKEDIAIIQSPVGLPGRAIENRFLKQVAAGERKPFKCFWKCLKTCDYRQAPYCIASALKNAKDGDLENGFAFAGANAYRVNEIVSVKELMDSLESEFAKAVPG